MRDATSQLRTATLRAKSDVANKLVSMFLHELSRRVCREYGGRVDSEEYGQLVRNSFANRCPYCLRDLSETVSVVEHLDGMNRYRVGLHIPGNVLVACKKCNGEKRRDDSKIVLTLAKSGWASFLSHNGRACEARCATCAYWRTVWPDEAERLRNLDQNQQKIEAFRKTFQHFERTMTPLFLALPEVTTKLYADCQHFAKTEIEVLLQSF